MSIPSTAASSGSDHRSELLALLRSDKFSGRVQAALKQTGLFGSGLDQWTRRFVAESVDAVSGATGVAPVDLFPARYSPADVADGVVALAGIGCAFNPARELGHLIPQAGGLAPLPGVVGLEQLLQRTGKVGMSQCAAVRKNDRIEVNPFDFEKPPVLRRPAVSDDGTANPIIAGLACVHVRDFGFHTVLVPVGEAELSMELAAPKDLETRAAHVAYRRALREVAAQYIASEPAVYAAVRADEAATRGRLMEAVAKVAPAAAPIAVSLASAARPKATPERTAPPLPGSSPAGPKRPGGARVI